MLMATRAREPGAETRVAAARSPPIQAKTRLGPVDDPLERDADRIADAVVSETPVGAIGGATGVVQRKCTECEAGEDQTMRRKAVGAGTAASAPVARAAAAVGRGGVPLSSGERAYFEPRFGANLSGIRVHVGDAAAQAANGVGARAFTLGRDIAFGRGEYRPDTEAGRHLLAHELAHTVQQERGGEPVVRRATYGTGTPPQFSDSVFAPVPEDEKPHVDEAMALIDDVVAAPSTYAECHGQFAERCPGGTPDTLATVWNRARIWRVTSQHAEANARAPTGGSDIGYSPRGYGQSPSGLARSLLHEAGHSCGIPGDATHWHAALISRYCMGPGSNELAMSFGIPLTGEAPLWLFSYRRFLGEWAGGRMRGLLGADLNLLGTGIEIGSAVGGTPEASRTPGEFGSAMVGVQGRLGGWGGTRYGGFSFRVELGLGVGRFAIRPATPDDAATTAIGPAWILQVGPRAEFLIKDGDAHVIPLTIGAALRLAAPTNGEAEVLQGALLSAETRW